MLTPISMFYESSPEEIEQDPHFHEPSFNFTGDDGEFEEDDEDLPSFVRAQEPSDKSQKDALGEYASIFYEDNSDVELKYSKDKRRARELSQAGHYAGKKYVKKLKKNYEAQDTGSTRSKYNISKSRADQYNKNRTNIHKMEDDLSNVRRGANKIAAKHNPDTFKEFTSIFYEDNSDFISYYTNKDYDKQKSRADERKSKKSENNSAFISYYTNKDYDKQKSRADERKSKKSVKEAAEYMLDSIEMI
jgi:hypothetical protein